MDAEAPKPRSQRRRAVADTAQTAQNSQSTAPSTQGVVLERTDTIEVPGIPAPGGLPASPEQQNQVTQVTSKAALGLEYMASTWPSLVPQFGVPHGITQNGGIHVLPLYIDELEFDFGTDMYQRMLNDAQIKACDSTLRDAILDRPIQVLAYEDQRTKDDPNQAALATAVAEFVRANLDQLPEGFQLVSWDMLEGISLGYKLAEMVFEVREIIPGNGPQTCLKSINAKPHEAVSIVVDRYNDEVGYLPRVQGTGMWHNTVAGELPHALGLHDQGQPEQVEIPGLVPPEKMLRFTWQPRNGDPRGTSNLRGAYVPWRLKIGLYPAYEAYLARFAQPSTALELEGGDLPPMATADGRLITNPAEKYSLLLTALRNFQSGGAMVVPQGKMNMLQASSNGQAYLLAFELVNDEITKSILLQTLTNEGQKYGTQALGEVQQDTKGLLVAMGKQAYLTAVRERLVKLLVRLNYGDAGLAVMPTLSFGETEQQDFKEAATAFAALLGAGTPEGRLLFPSQYNDMFEMLHMEPLDEAFVASLQALVEEQIKSAVQVAQDPMGLKAQAQMTDQQNAQAEQDQQNADQSQESYW